MEVTAEVRLANAASADIVKSPVVALFASCAVNKDKGFCVVDK
jgi:hypothetical protein